MRVNLDNECSVCPVNRGRKRGPKPPFQIFNARDLLLIAVLLENLDY